MFFIEWKAVTFVTAFLYNMTIKRYCNIVWRYIMNYFQRFLDYLSTFCNLKPIVALKDGFILTIPATLAGSLFLLIANFPIDGYNEFMTSVLGSGWADPLNQVAGATYDILAILVVLGLSYKFATMEGVDGISCSILALVSFLIVTSSTTTSASGEVVTGIIPKTWVGGNGIITAIIMGLLTSYIFCFFIKRKIIIKMPDSVPDGVSRAFAALLPGFVVFFLSAVVYTVCRAFGGLTFTELVFAVIQTPLQAFSGSLPGGIFLVILIGLLFWCGIHGPNIVGGVMTPIWTAAALSNQSILNSGETLVVGENAEILTIQVFDVFIKLGGCGITLGLLIAALLSAKSAQMKSITRLSIVPGIFNINEPVIFGLPIAFNAYFLVPFLVVPVVALMICYFSIVSGFLPPFNGVQVPWTTPPIISGFLLAGWKGIVVQIAILITSIVLYFPFVKKHDHICRKQEEMSAHNVDDEDLETLAIGL